MLRNRLRLTKHALVEDTLTHLLGSTSSSSCYYYYCSTRIKTSPLAHVNHNPQHLLKFTIKKILKWLNNLEKWNLWGNLVWCWIGGKVREECEIWNHVKMGKGKSTLMMERELWTLQCDSGRLTWNDGVNVISTGVDTWRHGIGLGSVLRSCHVHHQCLREKGVGPVRDDTFSLWYSELLCYLIVPTF